MTEIGPLGGNPPCGSAKNLKRNLKTLSFLVKLSYHTKELVIYSLKLITRHGDLISRDEIIAEVWNGRVISNNLIDNRIRAARAAIGDTGKAQRYIKTYPNRGYKFVGKVQASRDDTSYVETQGADAELSLGNKASKPAAPKRSFFHLRSPVPYLTGIVLFGLLGKHNGNRRCDCRIICSGPFFEK